MWKLCGIAYICLCVLVIRLFQGVLSAFLFQVQVLRNAGEEVTLTVSFLKRAPAFLKLPLNEDCACKPLLLVLKKTQFNARECLQLPNLLCIEGDWQQLFRSALLPEYEMLVLPGLVVTYTSSTKNAIFACKTDHQAFGRCESEKLQVKQ